ncbi:MAG: hypothetical protein PUC98_07610 [Clostridiales bacterium]|nr:hypothetical protein [Clostridiales bacterium]
MLTFSLDEYGDFENTQKSKKPVYIAGVVFDDNNRSSNKKSDETAVERRRIEAYYKAVIKEAAARAAEDAKKGMIDPKYADPKTYFVYPQALHSDSDPRRNSTVVKAVKTVVNKTMPEFIQKGTFNGKTLNDKKGNRPFPERVGRYHIFVMIKSDKGIEELLGDNINILSKDNYGVNLYFHMVDTLITYLLFYNPVLDNVSDVVLDIATRSSSTLTPDSPLSMEYKKQGLRPIKIDSTRDDSDVRFSLTNADVFRTVIAEEMTDADKPTLKIDFKAVSINYGSKAYAMEFLYLADSICSFLGYNVGGSSADEWIWTIYDRCKNLTESDDNLVFGYDSADRIFSKAWMKYLDGDYFNALRICYSFYRKHSNALSGQPGPASRVSRGFVSFYNEHWFRLIEKKMLENPDLHSFSMAVESLYNSLNSNNMSHDICMDIFLQLKKMVDPLKERSSELAIDLKRVIYRLYDIGISAYCHIGDSLNAIKNYELITEYADSVGLEEFLNTRNKLIEAYTDTFDYDKALELADTNLRYQHLVDDIKGIVLSENVSANSSCGSILSQRGQIYAFKRDPQAEADYRNALSCFSPDSADYKMTQSFLLHYYIDIGMHYCNAANAPGVEAGAREVKTGAPEVNTGISGAEAYTRAREAYLKEAQSYFNNESSLTKQLNYILSLSKYKKPVISVPYAVLVFVKALYVFRLDELSDSLWDKLLHIEQKIAKNTKDPTWHFSGHPSELIFKYLRFIALARHDSAAVKLIPQIISGINYSGDTVKCICDFAEIELLEKSGDSNRADHKAEQLCDFLITRFPVFNGIKISEDPGERLKWLHSVITYMYA